MAPRCAFVNEHLTEYKHLTTHMIVSRTPLTPEADNAKFKSYHLGTSVHSNCLSTLLSSTHMDGISPLKKSTLRPIKHLSWADIDAHIESNESWGKINYLCQHILAMRARVALYLRKKTECLLTLCPWEINQNKDALCWITRGHSTNESARITTHLHSLLDTCLGCIEIVWVDPESVSVVVFL